MATDYHRPLDGVLHSLALTLVIAASACSQGDASKPPAGSTPAGSTPCQNGTPQQTADAWLRDRLRTGAVRVSNDTLHLRETDPPEHRDSAKTLGNGYAAYFRAFYGDEAARLVPLWYWQQSPAVEAFVLSVPSEMYGTATALWTYDIATCSWSRGPMTSDAGGDGGEQYRLDTWLVDVDRDGQKDLVQRTKNWGEGDDGKPFTTDKLYVYYWSSDRSYFAETHIPDPSDLERVFDFGVK